MTNRQDKRNLKTQFYKKLLVLSREETKLSKQNKYSEYVHVSPILAGVRVHLTLIESMKNREEGLNEAVEAASSYLYFSADSSRRIELSKLYLKNYGNFSDKYNSVTYKDWVLSTFFGEDKSYIKGKLTIDCLVPDEYKKLSKAAQSHFNRVDYIKVMKYTDRHGKLKVSRIMETKYTLNVEKAWLKETITKMYINYIPIIDTELERKKADIKKTLTTINNYKLWHWMGSRVSNWDSYSKKLDRKVKRLNEKYILNRIVSNGDIDLDSLN